MSPKRPFYATLIALVALIAFSAACASTPETVDAPNKSGEMEKGEKKMDEGAADKAPVADTEDNTLPTTGAASGGPAMELDDGLTIEFLTFGDGPAPVAGQNVTVHYTGWLTDGTKFDSSVDRGEPFTFPLGAGKVIRGWDVGVANMKLGSKARLTIPPGMAYGDKNVGGGLIPPGSTLVFEVELLGIE